MDKPKKPKTIHDVRGSRIKCVNFQKCPLCYGCRRYSSIDPQCKICAEENKKLNICNKDLHRDEVTAKMITKENIKTDEIISFKNNNKIFTIKGEAKRGNSSRIYTKLL